MRTGSKATKSQSYKSRRDESKGMEKAEDHRAYASVKNNGQRQQNEKRQWTRQGN